MYAKLVIRNIRRSAQDYLIYLVTLVLCVGMFYAFLSLSSSYYTLPIGEAYSLIGLTDGMKVAIFLITLVIGFLIKYVNAYMLKRKQKAFAVQTMLGMEQKTTAFLFFCETFVMGLMAIGIGILLGGLLSQFVTSVVLHSFGVPYKFFFPFFPDTIMITGIFFVLIFCLVGLRNIRMIYKMSIIEMLQSECKMEGSLKKSKLMPIFVGVSLCVAIAFVRRGLVIYEAFYDARLEIETRLTFYGNILLPSLFIIFFLLYGLSLLLKKHQVRFMNLVGGLSVVATCIACCGMRVTSRYFQVSAEYENFYLLGAAYFLVFAVFGFFYCVAQFIAYLKERFPSLKYKRENLFLFGQLTAKLRTTSKTMAMISVTLGGAILIMTLAPLMSGWALGYLDERAIFDVQIYSTYNGVQDEAYLPQGDYAFIDAFLEEKACQVADRVQVELYFLERSDFKRRYKNDFPILAMSLSDYNHLRHMVGEEAVQLGEDEFAMQWQAIASQEEKVDFIKETPTIQVEGQIFKLAPQGVYEVSLGESMYNSYTDVVYIVPDERCEKLQVATLNYYILTEEVMPFDKAKALEQLLYDERADFDKQTGNATDIRLKTLQVNEGLSGALLTRLVLWYLGIILTIICFTVLALQQLSDAVEFKYRFGVLEKMGVDEKVVNTIVLKQMGIWFGLPIGVGVLMAIAILRYIINNNSEAFVAYVGVSQVSLILWGISSVMFIILVCYFITTWILFKRNIE